MLRQCVERGACCAVGAGQSVDERVLASPGEPVMTSFYNRAKAIEFAGEFWDRPCRSDTQALALGMDGARDVPLSAFWDQKKAPSSHYEPRFVFSTLFKRDQLIAMPKADAPAHLKPVMLIDDNTTGKKLEDCAHFLSQCLKAGGLSIKEQWSVPMLINELTAGEDQRQKPTAKMLCEKVSRPAAQRVIDAGLLNVGDMIGYYKPAGTPHEKSEYAHSAMYTGKDRAGIGRVTCHTASRFVGLSPPDVTDEWFLTNPNYSFTLLHIPRASESMATIGPKIAGWWRVLHAKKTVYYFISADGRAVRTNKAPTHGDAVVFVGAGDSRGYWFERHGTVTICWRADGSLVTMDFQKGRTPSSVAIDGIEATAERLAAA
jgi:hypothetical protein